MPRAGQLGPAILLATDYAAAVPAVTFWVSRYRVEDLAGEEKVAIDHDCALHRFSSPCGARYPVSELPRARQFGPAFPVATDPSVAVPAVTFLVSRCQVEDPTGEGKVAIDHDGALHNYFYNSSRLRRAHLSVCCPELVCLDQPSRCLLTFLLLSLLSLSWSAGARLRTRPAREKLRSIMTVRCIIIFTIPASSGARCLLPRAGLFGPAVLVPTEFSAVVPAITFLVSHRSEIGKESNGNNILSKRSRSFARCAGTST